MKGQDALVPNFTNHESRQSAQFFHLYEASVNGAQPVEYQNATTPRTLAAALRRVKSLPHLIDHQHVLDTCCARKRADAYTSRRLRLSSVAS